jgi:hypothetical protein
LWCQRTGLKYGFVFEARVNFGGRARVLNLTIELKSNGDCSTCVSRGANPAGTENVLQNRASHEKRRSERVNLRMPVMVTTTTVDGREVQEVTETAIVNAHGGLFRSTMEFLVAQPLVLTNLNSNLKESARVVRAEALENGGFGVAFEFDNAAPEFWQVEDAPDDWTALGLTPHGEEAAS